MSRPKMIGTVNGFVLMCAKIGNKRFSFDATVKGLVTSAVANGAKVGDVVESDIGRHVIVAAPNDPRCSGLWADHIW
jgi:hypothetical protein